MIRSLLSQIGAGRLVVAVLGSFACLLFLVFPGFAGVERWKVLHVAGVPALEVPFMDLRGVATWCDASAKGIDPAKIQTSIQMPDGTQQPNFLMNYPPVVLGLRYVGLDAASVDRFGALLMLVYVASVFSLIGCVGMREGLIWAFLLLSPLSVLLVERANLDIFVFALFAAALALRRHPLGAGVMIFIAGVLKLYPTAGLGALAMRSGRINKACAVAGIGLFCVYLICWVPGLSSIGGSLADQYRSCFGADVGYDILRAHGAWNVVDGGFISLLLQGFGIISCVIALVIGFLNTDGTLSREMSERSVFSFWMAAPMLIALFLLSNQMDYKWTFYLFMVPAVLEMVKSPGRLERGLAKFWMGCLLIYSYWTFFSGEESLRNALLKQGVMWLVFLASSGIAGMLLKCRQPQKMPFPKQ